MKLFGVMFALLMVLGGLDANAYSLKRLFQDVQLPTQRTLERQVFTAPIASNSTRILSGNAGPTSAAAKTVTTFAAQPDVPRNLEVSPGGTTTDIETCALVISGTDIQGKAISETFNFSVDQATKVVGNKAFKTVTSAAWPANCESGGFAATWSIGVGEKLGLNRCLDNAGDIDWSVYNGAREATLPTIASNATLVSSNTADFVGTMDGVKSFILFYVQNYKCVP